MFLVLVTFPREEVARDLTHRLVAERLAACATLLPGAISTFRWEGRVQTEPEVLAVLKTSRATYPRLEARLRELHPYDVPEIIALPVETGLAAYLAWVHRECEDTPAEDAGDSATASLKKE